MTPDITFIIPARNAARTLGDTIASLLAQSRANWAAIIIDDGSTDDTPNVATSAADPRITLIRQANTGVAAARNRGLSLATTPFIAFLDADDTLDRTYVEAMLPALGEHDLVAAAYRYTGPHLEDANWIISPPAPATLSEFNQFAIGAIVFRRESLIAHAGPAPFPAHSHHEDWELLLALRSTRWAPPITTPLYSYRLRPDSRTTALCEVWRDGLNLIAQLHTESAHRNAALRRWTLRNLARAATTANRPLSHHLFEHLDTLTPADLDTLSGALRWSIRRAAVAREPLSLQPRETWLNQILAALGDDPLAREALSRARTPDWSQVAAAAAARLRPNQTLVIYGAGRNGRELLHHLTNRDIPLALIDDAPNATPPHIPRVTIKDLSPNHLILITPDDRASILTKLGPARNAQILLPEQLVA